MSLASVISSAISSLATSLPEAAGVITYAASRTSGAAVVQMNAACAAEVDDPLSVEATATDRERMKFYVSLDEWALDSAPRANDTITLDDGRAFMVLSYATKARSVYVITAREV